MVSMTDFLAPFPSAEVLINLPLSLYLQSGSNLFLILRRTTLLSFVKGCAPNVVYKRCNKTLTVCKSNHGKKFLEGTKV